MYTISYENRNGSKTTYSRADSADVINDLGLLMRQRKPAKVRKGIDIVGRVWKDGRRWNWQFCAAGL